MLLYHGTSSRYLAEILRDGLKGRETEHGNWPKAPSIKERVYFSTWLPMYYAGNAIEEKDDMLILRVEVPQADMLPDEDWYAFAKLKPGSVETKFAAELSLKMFGCVCTLPVPPSAIKDYKVIPFDIPTWSILGGDVVPSPLSYKVLGTTLQARLENLFKRMQP